MLTTVKRYDIIQKYRHESCLYFLPYIDFSYGALPLLEKGRITRLRRGAVCSEVAARKECTAGTNPSRLKDEPEKGFISIRFFRCKAPFKVSFSLGDERAYFVLPFFQG